MSVNLQVVFDAADPGRLAAFWCDALGYEPQPPPPDFNTWEDWAREIGIPEEQWNDAAAIVDPAGTGPRIFIQRVPEPKSAKNRMHLDIGVSGGPTVPLAERRTAVDTAARRLTEAGATIVEPMDQRGEYWVVMRDPEGNEFCVH